MNSSIVATDSCPKYISAFIQHNMDDLNKIYVEGYEKIRELDEGAEIKNCILLFNCSEKDNIMNVQFADDDMMTKMITKESLLGLKSNIPEGKKLLFIMDLDISSVFLIHI